MVSIGTEGCHVPNNRLTRAQATYMPDTVPPVNRSRRNLSRSLLILLGHKTSTLPASRPERTLRRYDTTSCQGTLRTRGLFHAAAGRYPVAVIYDGQADCFVPKCRGRKKEAGDTRWSVSLEGIATACCRGCQKEQVSCRGESRASRVTCGCLARLAALPTACIDEVDFDTNAHAEEHPQ